MKVKTTLQNLWDAAKQEKSQINKLILKLEKEKQINPIVSRRKG